MEVLVISPDSLERTKQFFTEVGFEPDFKTLLDPERTVLKKYLTVREDGRINPSLFLIDKDGKLRYKYLVIPQENCTN